MIATTAHAIRGDFMMSFHSRKLEGVAFFAAMIVPIMISNHRETAPGQLTPPVSSLSRDFRGSTISIPLAASAPRGAVFAVENANDAGTGSLRQAILDANATPGTDTIVFDIPFEGPHVIALASPLPPVTDPVTLDGDTQPGTRPGSRRTVSPDLQVADNLPALRIVIDGAGAGHTDGLRLATENCIVRGLVLRHFDGSGISLTGAGNNLIEGNLISDNSGPGISLLSGSGNRITGNSLFSNRRGGIDLSDDGTDGIDLGDNDAGPNDRQNAPRLESVRRFLCDETDADSGESCGAGEHGWTTVISGRIDSLSNETFSLEFFATPPAESGFPPDTAPATSTGPASSAASVPGAAAAAATSQGKTFRNCLAPFAGGR